MRIVVIGGSGHIGSYLIPRLIQSGHEVFNVSRQVRKPYIDSVHWREVQSITANREEEDKNGTFAKRIKDLKADIVIDNICFTPTSISALIHELSGHIGHLLVTGTIWVHGFAEIVPTLESARRRPIGEYGINKNKIENILLKEFSVNKFPFTIIHPGHIVGSGWPCLNPQGNFNLNVFQTIIDGNELILPNLGLECVHHVHADDVAQIFQKAIESPSQSIGESFHVVSSNAMTLRGYAEEAFAWFGRSPVLKFLPLAELKDHLSSEDVRQTIEHVKHSPSMSIEKARSRLAYQPRYTSLDACHESVQWLISNNQLKKT